MKRPAILNAVSTSDDSEATSISSPQPTRKARTSARAWTFTSVASSTKTQLHQLDSGRCLFSCEKTPLQAVHIFPRKPPVAWIGEMWNTKSPLRLNSTQNLVTLCTDMHISFNDGDWALVPTEATLNKILKNKHNTFDKPYRGFHPNKKHDYLVVRIPQEEDEDTDEDEGTDENEDTEPGADGDADEDADEYEYPDGTDMDGSEQLNVPRILKHHAHPFYVIHNALCKMQKRSFLLSPEHYHLFALMNHIDTIWFSRVTFKRPRPTDESNDDKDHRQFKRSRTKAPANHDINRTNNREVRDSADDGKGKGKARGPSNTPSRFREFLSATSSDVEAPFDDDSEIAAWAAAVAAAGPLDVPDETVWSEKERVRKPIQDWHQWRIPYNRPKEHSKYCSSDWAMRYYSMALWMPSSKKR